MRTGDEFELFYGNPITGTSTQSQGAALRLARITPAATRPIIASPRPTTVIPTISTRTGRSATKALAATPVSGARLTSGFGMRKHPLLGYSKMHVGVDFGAPPRHADQGRRATASIEFAGRNGAYGNMVRLKHADGYETLYAHMSRLAENIAPGAKVNQGQIIGYVGATGRSTGPHLHYEVRAQRQAGQSDEGSASPAAASSRAPSSAAFLTHQNNDPGDDEGQRPRTTRSRQNQ